MFKKHINKLFKRSGIYIIIVFLFIGGILVPTIYKKLISQEDIKEFFSTVSVQLVALPEYPINFAKNILDFWDNSINTQQLHNQLIDLKQKYKAVIHENQNLWQENSELKKLLSVTKNEENVLTVNCFGKHAKLNNRALFIHAGKKSGIAKYNPVMNAGAIIGQIDEVTDTISRVMLISDTSSRIPIYFQESQEQGILCGEISNGILHAKFIKDLDNIFPGELVYSSGIGGFFSRGKIIGKVERVRNGKVLIIPAVDSNNLKYVQVIVSQ